MILHYERASLFCTRLWDCVPSSVPSCVCLCNLGGSDGSLSGSDEEEQERWEEMQIGKGVKRQPGKQVRKSIKHPVVIFCYFHFLPSFFTVSLYLSL